MARISAPRTTGNYSEVNTSIIRKTSGALDNAMFEQLSSSQRSAIKRDVLEVEQQYPKGSPHSRIRRHAALERFADKFGVSTHVIWRVTHGASAVDLVTD
jgi:hypothetical protein